MLSISLRISQWQPVMSSPLWLLEKNKSSSELQQLHTCLNETVALWGSPWISALDSFPLLRKVPNPVFSRLLKEVARRDEIISHQLSSFKAQETKNEDAITQSLLLGLEKHNSTGQGELLTDIHVHMATVDLLIGGTETTAAWLNWTVAFLLHRPEVQTKVYEELCTVLEGQYPKYSDRHRLPVLCALIHEVLRLRPVAPLAVPHRATRDSSIAGHFIPKNTVIIPNLFGAHHDPAVWTDPYSFKPDTMMFTSLGESVTLPCEIHSITSCSSVDWRLAGQHRPPTTLVENGRVKDSKRFELLKDCSLKIKHPAHDDAQLYSCDNKILNSSVSLWILEIIPTKPSATALELHCFLNSKRGYEPCNNTGICIQWSTEDNEPVRGSRFRFESPSECFSKLIITKKPTDHHRKWKCRLFQKGIFKTSVSYKTIVPDGVEEVFAAVGESLTLSCGNTSSHQSVWTRGGRVLANTTQAEAFHVTEDSLIISKVIPVHAGDYQCSRSDDKKRVFNKVRLHTVNGECGKCKNNRSQNKAQILLHAHFDSLL
ncbi:uncharacterized protein V6R79_018813 [Siganus canaliculatus]